jgi:hypothetical protein
VKEKEDMAKILQDSENLDEVLIALRINGIALRARLKKKSAARAFQVSENFCAISAAVRSNIGNVEKTIWQRHATTGTTEIRLFERDIQNAAGIQMQ